MVKSNEELQKLVKEQTETITSQKTITDRQNALIDEQNNLLEDKAARIETLECDAQYMLMGLDFLMDTINNLEQYGRRNSIKLNNFKLISPPKDEHDLSNSVCRFLNENVLKDARPLVVRDIERCHFVGRAQKDRPKQIIVKFLHYQESLVLNLT